MKMNIKNIFSAVSVAVMTTACIGDLDTTPLDKNTVTSESAYGADEAGYIQGLTKVYAQFASNNTTNLIVDDGGWIVPAGESNSVCGDVNADGKFNVADVVALQKWLLAIPDTKLADWKARNLCNDNRLDVFDLCLMKRELLKNN